MYAEKSRLFEYISNIYRSILVIVYLHEVNNRRASAGNSSSSRNLLPNVWRANNRRDSAGNSLSLGNVLPNVRRVIVIAHDPTMEPSTVFEKERT